MTGQEAKDILTNAGANQAEIAKILKLSPQAFNARFNVKYFKEAYMAEINAALGKYIFPVGQENFSNEGKIPVLDVRACAGNGLGLEEVDRVIEYLDIPSFHGCFAIPVHGDSMRGRYNNGDLVFVRQRNQDSSIEYGHAYVIRTLDDLIIKMVYRSKELNHYRLVSYNQETLPSGDRAYPDRDIHEREITAMYRIVGRLETEKI
jgi:phage repressor protein C with HTH and peptisase S24 domain